MARQNHIADDPLGDKRAVLKKRAEELAKRPGWDLKRALTVLEETAWEAKKYLERDKVRELFERESPERLLFRVDFAPHLFGGKLPLYSLEELEELTEAFIEHLKKNSEKLIKTGYTWDRFGACRFLDWRLNRLYFTELPMKPARPDARTRGALDMLWKDKHPDRETPKRWIGGSPAADVNILETIIQAGKKGRVSELKIPELSIKNAKKLLSMREKLFDLKIAILEALLRAIERGRSDGLWKECLALLTAALTGEEARFLLRMDQFYLSLDTGERKEVPGRLTTTAGGLSDVLVIIAHYEEELQTGPWAGTREHLGDLCVNGKLVLPSNVSESYFQLVGTPEGKQVDEAITVMLSNPPRRSWNVFCGRADKALKYRFEVIKTYRRPEKLDREHGEDLDELHEMIEKYASLTGDMPDISFKLLDDTAEDHVFRRKGRVWEVIFEGKSVHLVHQRGFQFIQALLKHQGEKMSPWNLIEHVATPHSASDSNIGNGITREQMRQAGLTVGVRGDSGPVLDKDYREQLMSRRQELKQEIEEAEEWNDPERKAKAEEELEIIEKKLSEGIDLHGKDRKLGSELGRARLSVTRAIDRALEGIRNEHKELWCHLKDSIHTGTECYYTPTDPPINWILE